MERSYHILGLTVLDATGKFPSGLAQGNLNILGDFDECLQIKAEVKNKTVEGKYCMGEIKIGSDSTKRAPRDVMVPAFMRNSRPSLYRWTMGKTVEGKYCMGDIPLSLGSYSPKNLNLKNTKAEGSSLLKWSICVPHVCTSNDLNSLFSNITEFTENMCQSESTKPELETGDYIVICFLAIIAAIIFISTMYDVYLDYSENKAYSELFIAFSFLTNGRKLFHVSNKPSEGQLTCISGIRTISMMWVLISHSFMTTAMAPLSNMLEIFTWPSREENMYIVGATVSVDTFFLMAGLVIVYVYMGKPQMRIMDIPSYYLHRYLRLTPVLAVLIAVHATILKFFGEGPFWPNSKLLLIDDCKNYWWTALLYVQNYVHPLNQCVGQSWYLAVDTQLFFLSPLILIPLKKYLKFTLSAIVLLTLLSMGAAFYVAWHYHLEIFFGGDVFETKYYLTTHTRAAPWLIGLITGYLIYKHKKEETLKLKWPVVVILWIIALTVMCVCVFCGNDLLTNNDKGWNSTHIALVRPTWALGVSWVIYACVMGYGGPINTFLSLPVFQILGRLSYSMYLVHIVILTLLALNEKTPVRFSDGHELYVYWAKFMMTFFLAMVWSLAFESPVMIIEKYIRNRNKPGKAVVKPPTEDDKEVNVGNSGSVSKIEPSQ